MLAQPIATAALLLTAGAASAAKSKAASNGAPPSKIDFMRAMQRRKNKRTRRLSVKDFQAEIRGDSERSKELRKKIIERSTASGPRGSGGERKLEEEAEANANQANYNYNNNNNANQANYNNANAANYYANKNYKYSAYKDGSDDYFMAYGEWENTFGFDPTQFSISYHRCAAVRQFDDVIAAMEDTDSVFATKHFAVFRFCPEQTCMGFQEEEDDCGCEDQCYEIFEEMQNNGYEASDNDEEKCVEACTAQCVIWQQQYGMYGGGQAANAQEQAEAEANANKQAEAEGQGNVRKLQYYNYNNANGANSNWWSNNGYNNNYNSNIFSSYAFDPYYADEEEEQELWGARGEGCQNNYGEYMLEVKDYLELMMEWQEERLETYCEYCEECMFNVYQVWLKNGGQRDLKYEDFKNSKEHQRMRGLGNYYNVCPEYDTCIEYQNVCKGGVVDEWSDYFECQEVEKANGQVAYIGPHCAEDGFTITLGVYADEYCNEYIGKGVDIANFLGEEINPEEDMLRPYYNSAYGPTFEQLKYINEDQVCIPCRKGDMMWEKRGNNNDDDNINYDDNEINELCENLYEVSARCDKHYRSYNSKSKQAKFAEAVAQEDLTCDFIDSVVMGNYNEMGFVNLGDQYTIEKQSGWMGNNIYAQQYGQELSKVTGLQIFFLIMSILAVVILGVWASTLHRSLTKTGPWRPRRGLAPASPGPTALTRQNSGIVMGRSASNTSYYMS